MNGTTTKRVIGIGLAALCVAATAHVRAAAPSALEQATPRSDVLVDPRIEESIGSDGTVDVIVGLDIDTAPEARLSEQGAAAQRAKIGRAQDAVETALAGTAHRVVRRFGFIPFMAMEADAPAIRALRASPHVRTIELDDELVPTLTDTPAIADFAATFASGLKGSGSTVAIIDTGVDRYHRFLTDAVVYEACFTSRSTCPNGESVQVGHGSARPCALERCNHGTHVAGIVAGRGAVNAHGVAPAVNLYPIQVFSLTTCTIKWFNYSYPCIKSSSSDSIAALEHVFDRRHVYSFAAVNMSLGTTTRWSDRQECSLSSWSYQNAIRQLHAADIATVASAGNDSDKNGVVRPACVVEAISVGATTKSDAVVGYSNSAPWLDLLAPGADIVSSVPGGGFERLSGTSMAAPHVSGAWAVLKSVAPEATVDQVLTALRSTGRRITDPGNDVTTPRISVASAVERLGTIRIEDAVASEGTTAAFRLTLAKSYPYPVTVRYRSVGGSAVPPGDYTSVYGQQVFQPGQTSKTVNVAIVDDDYREGAERFTVQLTWTSSGVRANRSVATGTIRASDNVIGPRPPYEGPGDQVNL